MARPRRPRGIGGFLLILLALILLLAAVPLIWWGLELAALGDTWFYFILGTLTAITGILLIADRMTALLGLSSDLGRLPRVRPL